MLFIKFIFLSLFPILVWAQNSDIVVDAVHLRESVYMLRANTPFGNSTSVVSIGNDNTFLADTSFAMATKAIEEKVEELGGGGGPVAFATATHFHGDHTEGFEILDPSVVVITPTKQRNRLATGEVVGGERPLLTSALPAISFNSSVEIYLNNEEIQIYTPRSLNSHTDTDAFIYFRNANVLYIGDHLFLNRYPIVDLDNGGDIEGYFSNIKYIIVGVANTTQFEEIFFNLNNIDVEQKDWLFMESEDEKLINPNYW